MHSCQKSVCHNNIEPTNCEHSQVYRLCVYASGSLITDVFNFFTLISVSCLHFGQNRGKFSSIVSSRIFIRVSLWHIWHSTQFSFSNASLHSFIQLSNNLISLLRPSQVNCNKNKHYPECNKDYRPTLLLSTRNSHNNKKHPQ